MLIKQPALFKRTQTSYNKAWILSSTRDFEESSIIESSLSRLVSVAESKVSPLRYDRLRWYEEVMALATGVFAGVLAATTKEMTTKQILKVTFWLCLSWICSREVLRELNHSPQYTTKQLGFQYTKNGVHYVTQRNAARVLHCSHGFGANCLSFSALASCLNQTNDPSILAHDHPGFGLSVCDFNDGSALDGSIAIELTDSLDQVIYLGHSFGALAATEAALYRNAPLILIAPAISVRRRRQNSFLLRIMRIVAPLLSSTTRFILRRAVHSSGFWEIGLSAAWGDKTANTTAFYALPSRCEGWDRRLFSFLKNRLYSDEPADDQILIREAAKRLPGVLLIHGTQDPVLTVDNSRLLFCALPQANLIEVNNAGHNAHEQFPHAVTNSIRSFLAEHHLENMIEQSINEERYSSSATYTWPELDHHNERGPIAVLGKSRIAVTPQWPILSYYNSSRSVPRISCRPPSSPCDK
uniref:AB hydrolase-1 domain-containing protein n=1 Tax=Aureoumbra lagunensis TaxID=44058 RepID=A0A7S3NID3_9STRA|mmetsp:Transcript_6567/g.9771  ORF Transcript_6567/g.9771 Transcript_6567/m.9771 type:complete len:469 (+) Transcript_6567:113-1519(+)